jgi:hypothetical protein
MEEEAIVNGPGHPKGGIQQLLQGVASLQVGSGGITDVTEEAKGGPRQGVELPEHVGFIGVVVGESVDSRV